MHRAIAVTPVVHVPVPVCVPVPVRVPVRVTLALKFSRIPYLDNQDVLYTYSCNMLKNNMMHKCNTIQIRVDFLTTISQNRQFKPLGKNEVGGHA